MQSIEEIERFYRECSQGNTEPDLVIGPWETMQKFMRPEEVAAVEKFREEHPGKNWSMDRETLIVTEEPEDEEECQNS